MAYADQIETLKSSLNGYSAEEKKLAELYKQAQANLEQTRAEAQKQLNKNYYRDRNEAITDSSRAEKNAFTSLASRGLGFSGEAAQTKLNSNVALSGRLGELAREKAKADWENELNFADGQSKLSMEQAEKLKELMESKNKLNADIAEMELKKESGDADRLAQRQQAEADRAAQSENREKEMAHEKELQQIKINAEKDMLERELSVKSSSSSASGTQGGGKNEQASADEEDGSLGYTPGISEKELAKQIVSAASGGSQIDSDAENYRVSKFLLELLVSHKINTDYYKELVVMLKSFGYTEKSEPLMRVEVVSYEADKLYEEQVNHYYDKYILDSYEPDEARAKAREVALNEEFDYIFENCNNNTEFRICCKNLKIASSKVEKYLANRTPKSISEGKYGYYTDTK